MSHVTRRNRLPIVWVVGLFLLLAGTIALAGDKSKTVFVKVSNARVRSAPTVRSEVVGVVAFGARMEALEHVDDWYRVLLADGTKGFIYDELVSSKDVGRLWVEDGAADVHRSPSAYAPVVGTLEVGAEVRPVGKRDDWYRVELEGGRAGWVHEDALDDDPPGALYVSSMSASVHAGPSPMSAVVAELPAGTKLMRVGQGFDRPFLLRSSSTTGRQGSSTSARCATTEPEHLFVDVGEAEIKSDPTEYGERQGRRTLGHRAGGVRQGGRLLPRARARRDRWAGSTTTTSSAWARSGPEVVTAEDPLAPAQVQRRGRRPPGRRHRARRVAVVVRDWEVVVPSAPPAPVPPL
ncbi:MAG: SH3 domain-containing protein [Thermoanaerobaculaceae bacterium]